MTSLNKIKNHLLQSKFIHWWSESFEINMCRISSRSPRVIEPAFDPRNHGTGARPRCFCLKCAVRLSCVARTHVMPGSFVSCPYFINTHRRCFPVQLWRKVVRTVYWAGFLIKKCTGRLPAGWCQCIEDSIAFMFAGCWEKFSDEKVNWSNCF